MITQLESENILQLLLAMAAQADSSDYAPWNMVVLDILHLVFRSVKPDELMVPVQKVCRVLLQIEFEGISLIRRFRRDTDRRESTEGHVGLGSETRE